MNERDSHIPKDEVEKETKEMCESCVHKEYCIAAFKKDHWCGNHTNEKDT